MSGFEIAGLVLAGAQIGGSIISKLSSSGGTYQEVTTTTKTSGGELSSTRITSTEGAAVAAITSNGDMVARSWQGGRAMGVSSVDCRGSESNTEVTKQEKRRKR